MTQTNPMRADTRHECWRSRWFGRRMYKYRPGWLICGHCGKLEHVHERKPNGTN